MGNFVNLCSHGLLLHITVLEVAFLGQKVNDYVIYQNTVKYCNIVSIGLATLHPSIPEGHQTDDVGGC